MLRTMKTSVKWADDDTMRSQSFGQRRNSEVLRLKTPEKEPYRSASAMTIGERM